MLRENLYTFYLSHRGGINGSVIGFIIALTVLIVGFWQTLFIAICVSVGYYIGKRVYEDKDIIKNFLDRILPPGTYR